MILLLYNLLFPLGLLIFLPRAVTKMLQRGNYGRNLGQRFGFYDRHLRERLRDGERTWLHAVSVGEVAIALKLAARLREVDPDFRCVLTTTTSTGFAVANRAGYEWIDVIYNPLDWWPIMWRALALIRPTRVVLIEAEVWPNLVAIASRRRIPVALVNARLSRRSESRFRRFVRFVRPTFARLDLVCVQELVDIERWSALGVARERIHHVGSVKFDFAAQPPGSEAARFVRASGFSTEDEVLFGGSTHDGEEELLARVWLRAREEFPRLRLVIAPRHVERTAAITQALVAMGLRVIRRTELPCQGEFDCLLIDTTGELREWYSIATVVFIGKSISARGGQNPVEAIVAGKPVMFGPHMENFQPLAAALVRERAAIQVNDEASLTAAVRDLLRDRSARETHVSNAHFVLRQHRGATERTALLLSQLQPHRR